MGTNPFLAGLYGEDDPLVTEKTPPVDPAMVRRMVATMPMGGAPQTANTMLGMTTRQTPAEELAASTNGAPVPQAASGVSAGPAEEVASASDTRQTVAQGPKVSRPVRFELPPVDRMVERFQEWQAVAAATPGVLPMVAPQLAAWRNLTVQQHARAFKGDPTASPEQAAAYARHMGEINGKLGKPMTWDEASRIASYVEERADGATQRFLKAVSTGNDKGAQSGIDEVFGQDVTIVGKRPTKVDLHGNQVDDWEWTVKMPDGSQQAYTGTQLNFMYGDQRARVQYAQAERQRQIEQAKLELEHARLMGDPAKTGAAYRKLMEVQGVGINEGAATADLPADLAPYAPFLGRLRGNESRGRVNAVSPKNAVGLDQFTQGRLDDYNRQFGTQWTVEQLKNNVPLQNQVAAWHYPDIDRFIQDNGLTKYLGETINGVEVTLDGMRAVAHLGGSPGLKRYLESKGDYNPDDGKTKLSDYMRQFRGQTVPLGGGPAVALDGDDATIGARILQAGAPGTGQKPGAGGMPNEMTKTQEKAFEAWSKERLEIQKGMDSDAVKQRRMEELNDFYAPILGGLIPGLSGGLTAEEAAIFGTGAGPQTGKAPATGTKPGPAAGGTAGPAAGTTPPAPPASDRGLMDNVTTQLKTEGEARQKAADLKAKTENQARAYQEAVTEAQAAIQGDAGKAESALKKMEQVYPTLTADQKINLERLTRILLAMQPKGATPGQNLAGAGANNGYLPYPW